MEDGTAYTDACPRYPALFSIRAAWLSVRKGCRDDGFRMKTHAHVFTTKLTPGKFKRKPKPESGERKWTLRALRSTYSVKPRFAA